MSDPTAAAFLLMQQRESGSRTSTCCGAAFPPSSAPSIPTHPHTQHHQTCYIPLLLSRRCSNGNRTPKHAHAAPCYAAPSPSRDQHPSINYKPPRIMLRAVHRSLTSSCSGVAAAAIFSQCSPASAAVSPLLVYGYPRCMPCDAWKASRGPDEKGGFRGGLHRCLFGNYNGRDCNDKVSYNG